MDDYYEVISLDPLHKLEKELKELRHLIKKSESVQGSEISSILKEVIDLIKTTQEIITIFMKSNVELQSKITELITKIENTNNNIVQLLDILKEASMEIKEEKAFEVKIDTKDLEKRIDELKELNKESISILKEIKELLKSSNQKPIIRPPLPPKPYIYKPKI